MCLIKSILITRSEILIMNIIILLLYYQFHIWINLLKNTQSINYLAINLARK